MRAGIIRGPVAVRVLMGGEAVWGRFQPPGAFPAPPRSPLSPGFFTSWRNSLEEPGRSPRGAHPTLAVPPESNRVVSVSLSSSSSILSTSRVPSWRALPGLLQAGTIHPCFSSVGSSEESQVLEIFWHNTDPYSNLWIVDGGKDIRGEEILFSQAGWRDRARQVVSRGLFRCEFWQGDVVPTLAETGLRESVALVPLHSPQDHLAHTQALFQWACG